jgi:hypothetical protein
MRVGTAYLGARAWAWRWKDAACRYRREWTACLANWNACMDENAALKSQLAATQERLAQMERDEDHRETLNR